MLKRVGYALVGFVALLLGGFVALLIWGGVSVVPGGVQPTPSAENALGDRIDVGRSGDTARFIVPVAGVAPAALTDTWGQARADGAREHHAIDIMAPRGTWVVAAASGTVEKLFDSADGGHTLYIRSGDRRAVTYYAHLDAYRADLREGQAVRQGYAIATVGSTGNASPAAPHLHFEIKVMRPGERWWEGANVNPYPLLAGNRPAR